MYHLLLASLLALQGQGVIENPVQPATPAELPPTPEEVFAVPKELRAALHQRVGPGNSPEQKLKRLVDFMLGAEGLQLQYVPGATHTVGDSYRTRQVNCLSFTLLAVARARELGMPAQAQQIDRVLAWSATGEVVMQSMHANAAVSVRGLQFIVDIAADRVVATTGPSRISDSHLLALYYDNRAMELLAAGRIAEARVWLDTSLKHYPDDAALWNNAGVLSLRSGDRDGAEALFLKAQEKDPKLTSTLYNLVSFYRDKGDIARATRWQAKADEVLRKDPFYQFSLGQARERAQDYAGAVQQYRRAIKLNRNEQMFHFALGRVYFQMGDIARARDELHSAALLGSDQDRLRYQAKLDALRGTVRR
jgi:tetratricopeptide (TPR) repeat protein